MKIIVKKIPLNHRIICILLTFTLLLFPAAAAAEDTVTLTFNAVVAGGIPEGSSLTIGSGLNGWNPGDPDWYAVSIDDEHFQLVVTVDAENIGTTFEYKWTLQSPETEDNRWAYGENASGTGLFGNRAYTVKEDGNVIYDTVSFPDKPTEIQHTLTCGALETAELEMPQFSDRRTRTVRIWLPQGYNADDVDKKYSVLYMHDGQNLFDTATSFLGEWEVDETVTELMEQGYPDTIVVGIDNGSDYRFNELSPPWQTNDMGKEYITAPDGDKYARFIVETVKPYIDEHYNTRPQRQYTGIGGSSMGGIMSLYMACEYADVFSGGVIFSPALHVYTEDALDNFFDNYDFTSMENLPNLFIFAGGKTGGSAQGSPYDEACITKYVDIIKTNLTGRGYPREKIGTLTDEEQCHIESTWAMYLPTALQWLNDADPGEATSPTESQTASSAPTEATTASEDNSRLLGDANCDGELTVEDVTAIQKHLADAVPLSADSLAVADTNGDGRVSISDATEIQKHLAGMNSSLR